MSFIEIQKLIKDEQKIQSNHFIDTTDLDEYLIKIQNNAEFITHYSEGRCAGFVAFYCNDKQKHLAFITLVLLAPEFRGNSIARDLILYALSFCKRRKFQKCGLEVRKGNYSAIKLYESCGFNVERETIDSLIMSAHL